MSKTTCKTTSHFNFLIVAAAVSAAIIPAITVVSASTAHAEARNEFSMPSQEEIAKTNAEGRARQAALETSMKNSAKPVSAYEKAAAAISEKWVQCRTQFEGKVVESAKCDEEKATKTVEIEAMKSVENKVAGKGAR